jgi:hypothetical protein
LKLDLRVIGVVVVVALVLVGAGLYFVSLPPGGKTTTTSSTVAAPDLKSQYSGHIGTIGTRNVTAVLLDYQDSAVVTWTGHAAGLEGVYSGTGNIRLLFASALSTANTISFVPHSIIQTNKSGLSEINSTVSFTGRSAILGSFNGNLVSSTDYTNSGGRWKISAESWNYLVFNATSKGGATTFPEWQKVGPINVSNRSPDWLHNFVWDYGGYVVAIAIYAIVVAIGVALIVRKVRTHQE